MRVSVIIPFNKGDEYLKDCLNSLAEQEYTDYEILLVADHYSGDIRELMAPYTGKLPIKIFELVNPSDTNDIFDDPNKLDNINTLQQPGM